MTAGRLLRAARRARDRLGLSGAPVGLVVAYHRVARLDDDPFGLAVSPKRFAGQMEAISRLAGPVPLRAISGAEAGGAGNGRPRVAVTFDDGYVDVLETAVPVLERFGVPATVFLVSRRLGATYWWDRLAPLLARLDPMRPIHVDASGDVLRWDPDRVPEGATARAALRRWLHAALRARDDASRNAVLTALEEHAGIDSRTRPRARQVNAEEARRLVGLPGVEVGAHGATHTPLGELSADRAREDVAASRRELETVLGRTVDAFAYPHGSVSAAARRAVRDAGFVRACTSRAAVVRSRDPVLQLPRVWAPDIEGEAFERWLDGWLS